MPNPAEAFDIQKPSLFKVSTYYPSPDATEVAARKRIKLLLDTCLIGFNPAKIKKSKFDDAGITGSGDLFGEIVNAGIVWVKADVTASTSDTLTGKEIHFGDPVVFDMKNGNGVTGINTHWGADEYKIVGTALKDLLGTTSDLIPIKLEEKTVEQEHWGWVYEESGITVTTIGNRKLDFDNTSWRKFVGNVSFDDATDEMILEPSSWYLVTGHLTMQCQTANRSVRLHGFINGTTVNPNIKSYGTIGPANFPHFINFTVPVATLALPTITKLSLVFQSINVGTHGLSDRWLFVRKLKS